MRTIALRWQHAQSRVPKQSRHFFAAASPVRRRVDAAPAEAPERALLSLLFTDIVGSTALAERAGDARWSVLLVEHQSIVRRLLARYGGTEIDAVGDGFFCTFTSPTRAVCCAQAIEAAVRAIGIEIRAGVHAGECERHRGRVRGIAVHVGARIAATAAPGQVRVSATVRELAAGSHLVFLDGALCSLPGVSQPYMLYRVAGVSEVAAAHPTTATLATADGR